MKNIKIQLLSLLLVLAWNVKAQIQNPGYYVNSASSYFVPSGTGGNLPNVVLNETGKTAGELEEKDVSAKLHITLDLGDDYVTDKVATFGVSANIIVTSGSYSSAGMNLEITEGKPEAMLVLDLLSEVNNFNPALMTISVTPSSLAGTPGATPSTFIEKLINNKLRLSAKLVREYGINVRETPVSQNVLAEFPSISVTAIPPVDNGRLVIFSWDTNPIVPNDYIYPNYQIQILRLFNEEANPTFDLNNEIHSTVDWSKALTVETQSYQTGITLTVAEGSGFYIWRVRPIGTYYEGGIANHENYGLWSTTVSDFADLSTFQKNPADNSTNHPYYFYLTDPDENLNWIYNRVFSEGQEHNEGRVRTSEGMSYADGLLRTRQSQAYNSENNTVMVSQSVSDFSGRPALNTVPVPIDGNLSGYKGNFAKPIGETEAYNAFDFDYVDKVNPADDATWIDYSNSPKTIDDSGEGFEYYSGSDVLRSSEVINKDVPDAQEYLFSRTVFKTDGTGRPEESSGLGKRHALGEQINGMGRTTRVSYRSAADWELIRIFGDEAPLGESVIVTETTDPNNVRSITYTSKEGKTIATAMIQETTPNPILDPIKSGTIPDFTIKLKANQNHLSSQKYTSSQRINLATSKTITLSYKVSTTVSSAIGCGGVGCNLKVRFYITDLKRNIRYESDKVLSSTSSYESFDVATGDLTFPAGWGWVNLDDPNDLLNDASDDITVSGTNNNGLTLRDGEYIITKEVYSANSEEAIEESIAANMAAYGPILEALANKMTEVSDDAGFTDYTDVFLPQFQSDYADYVDTPNTTTNNVVLDLLGIVYETGDTYMLPTDFTTPSVTEGTGEYSSLIMGTECCVIDVAIPKVDFCPICKAITGSEGYDGIKTLRESTTGNIAIDRVITTSIWYQINQRVINGNPLDATITDDGFIEYLIEKLIEKGYLDESFDEANPLDQAALQAELDLIAPGFTKETLAFMLTNMLTSRYYTEHVIDISSTGTPDLRKAEFDPITGSFGVIGGTPDANNDLTPELFNSNLEFNYDCKELYNKWKSAVDMIQGFDFDDVNIMDTYNDEEGGDASEDHYDDSGEETGGLLNFIISIKMRKFNNSDEGLLSGARLGAMFCLPCIFMEMADYQFANILDENETVPLDYAETQDFSSPTNPYYVGGFTSPSITGQSTDNAPYLVDDYDAGDAPYSVNCECESGSSSPSQVQQQLFYPYIVKPEWMFKYFEYNAFEFPSATTFEEDNRLIVTQMGVELATCYSDPLAVAGYTRCEGEPCLYTHENWSSDERYNFYKSIALSGQCPDVWCPPGNTTPVTVDDAPDKPTLIVMLNDELIAADASCDGRAGEIKNAIVEELLGSCYDIVDCKTGANAWEVDEKEIDKMVEAAIAQCHAQVQTVRGLVPEVGAVSDNSLNQGTSPYGVLISEIPAEPTPENCYYIDEQGVTQMVTDVKIDIQLFAECDRLILDQVLDWSFEVHIDPVTNYGENPNCTGNDDTEEWFGGTFSDNGPFGCEDEEGSISGSTNTYSKPKPPITGPPAP